mmetsp:Transcript_22385/g.55432  ORF Transcript_22385/g.55432 Transcript_22385/m.55432 type:complete len:189 (-) Transcript_22385:382-948(-)
MATRRLPTSSTLLLALTCVLFPFLTHAADSTIEPDFAYFPQTLVQTTWTGGSITSTLLTLYNLAATVLLRDPNTASVTQRPVNPELVARVVNGAPSGATVEGVVVARGETGLSVYQGAVELLGAAAGNGSVEYEIEPGAAVVGEPVYFRAATLVVDNLATCTSLGVEGIRYCTDFWNTRACSPCFVLQ